MSLRIHFRHVDPKDKTTMKIALGKLFCRYEQNHGIPPLEPRYKFDKMTKVLEIVFLGHRGAPWSAKSQRCPMIGEVAEVPNDEDDCEGGARIPRECSIHKERIKRRFCDILT